MSPRKTRILICFAVAFLAFRASAADQKDERRNGEKVWKLSDYLKGTPDEMRRLLSHEVERLAAERAVEVAKLPRLQGRFLAAEQAVQQKVLSSPEYIAVQKEIERASDHLGTLGDDTPEEKLAVRTSIAQLKNKLEQTRKDLSDQNPDCRTYRQAVAETEGSIRQFDNAIGSAESWRRELVNATENSYSLEWPVRVGDVGVVRTLIPSKIDAGGFEGECLVAEVEGQSKEKEGLVDMKLDFHPCILIVRGMPKVNFPINKEADLDTVTFEVTKVTLSAGGGEAQIVVKPTTGDLSKMLQAINTLHTDLSTADLDAMVKSWKKTRPKTGE